ncbi:hypothetical protein [Thiorhodococcus fuscus]|uniref:Lipoprotein n=1 Tax=Thiorhodococcus fuscus TaxID=527200 RepID=A0ABW4YB76_9GAMM
MKGATPKSTRLRRHALTAGGYALVILLMTTGCGSIKKDKMAITLQTATHGYQSALRWGYFESAYAFVDPDQRKNTPMPPSLTGLRLTGYDVVQPPGVQKKDKEDEDEDSAIATQIVHIEYLYEDRQVVKSLTDRQIWRWDAEKKTWWLTSGLPAFE